MPFNATFIRTLAFERNISIYDYTLIGQQPLIPPGIKTHIIYATASGTQRFENLNVVNVFVFDAKERTIFVDKPGKSIFKHLYLIGQDTTVELVFQHRMHIDKTLRSRAKKIKTIPAYAPNIVFIINNDIVETILKQRFMISGHRLVAGKFVTVKTVEAVPSSNP